MKIKNSRTIAVSYHPSILHAMEVVDRVIRTHTGRHMRVTGLGEEGHSEGSLHYGVLGDIRVRAFDFDADEAHIPGHLRDEIDADIRRRLGEAEFDFIWESLGTARAHGHVEVDPK